MKKLKDLTAEVEIKAIKNDWWTFIVLADSFNCVVIKSTIVEGRGAAILMNAVAKSKHTGHFYEIIYLDPGSESPATLEDANYGGPDVHQVYPYQEVITSYKREKPEVSK